MFLLALREIDITSTTKIKSKEDVTVNNNIIVNNNTVNYTLTIKMFIIVKLPPCSSPSAAVLCHKQTSPEEVIWLVMKI